MSSGLEPDELRRLLLEAVEPIRSSPDAYRRIRTGIVRRRRMRVPAMAFGGLAMAGLIGFAYVVIEPRPSSDLVEPAPPPLTQSVTDPTAPRIRTSPPGHGGTMGNGGVRSPTAPGRSESPPGTEPNQGPTATAMATRPVTTPSNVNSPTLPPPVSRPARAGDMDGDGVTDTPVLSGSMIVVTLSRLGKVSLMLQAVSPLTASIIDIDADGYGELIVQTGGSGDTRSFNVVELTPNVQLQAVSGSPLPLRAGTSGSHGDGFRCESGTVVVTAGDSSTGTAYSVTSTTYRLTGTGFSQVGSPTSSTVDLASAPSPFTADCGIS